MKKILNGKELSLDDLEEISGGLPKGRERSPEPLPDWEGDCTACGSELAISYFGLAPYECAVDPSLGFQIGDRIRIRGVSNFMVSQFHNRGNFIYCGTWPSGYPDFYDTKYMRDYY